MPLVGLRVIIILFRLLSLSTNSTVVATLDLQPSPVVVSTRSLKTQERSFLTKRQNDLNNWRQRSAIIIHHLPGLLTKNAGGNFTVKFLDPKSATMKSTRMENGNISGKRGNRICRLAKRFARALLKHKRHQMRKHRVRGFLTRMFSSVNFPSWTWFNYKQGENKKIRSLVRHCLNQTKP